MSGRLGEASLPQNPMKTSTMTRNEFRHRHSKFPPTLQNVFLLGFCGGAAAAFIIVTTILKLAKLL